MHKSHSNVHFSMKLTTRANDSYVSEMSKICEYKNCLTRWFRNAKIYMFEIADKPNYHQCDNIDWWRMNITSIYHDYTSINLKKKNVCTSHLIRILIAFWRYCWFRYILHVDDGTVPSDKIEAHANSRRFRYRWFANNTCLSKILSVFVHQFVL